MAFKDFFVLGEEGRQYIWVYVNRALSHDGCQYECYGMDGLAMIPTKYIKYHDR